MLPAAIDEARRNNPDVIALRARARPVRERPAQERFLPPPMLEAQIWQWPIDSLNPANTNMFAFMATQDVPGRGKRALRAAVAGKDVELAANEVESRTRQIVDQVKRAYADLFVARAATEIHLSTADVVRQLEQASQARYAAGRISQQDVLKAVVELSTLHGHLIMLEEQAKVAAARLNALLGRAPDAAIGPLTNPHEQTLVAELQTLIEAARRDQPELKAARLAVERAEAELAVTKRDYKPDYSIQAGYAVMPRQSDSIMARVGLTWPSAPWSRGRLDRRSAEQLMSIEAARADERAIDNRIRLAVQEAYIRVKAAEQRLSLFRTTILPQARQTLEVSRVAYQTDRIDFLALLDNQRTVLTAQLEYSRALADFEQAAADLEQAVGSDLPPAMFGPAARAGT